MRDGKFQVILYHVFKNFFGWYPNVIYPNGKCIECVFKTISCSKSQHKIRAMETMIVKSSLSPHARLGGQYSFSPQNNFDEKPLTSSPGVTPPFIKVKNNIV